MVFLPLFPGQVSGLDKTWFGVLLYMQRWMCWCLCLGSLESTPSPFLVSSLRGEAGTVSEINVQRKHLPLFFLIITSNFLAWAIGLDLSCSISIKNVWDYYLGNAANQSGNKIFVLVWHWHYTCSLRWIPIGGSLQLIHEGCSGVKAKLSALLVIPLGYKINLCFWKDLKKIL